ncbi:MAG: DUF934 domain-containing protein [Methylococcaceae bacterium]|nr:DUF934 domain-containing protein [Methylococcaceae bacterium]
MTVIKDAQGIDNFWTHIDDDALLPSGAITVSLKRWMRERDDLLRRDEAVGVRLAPSDAPETLGEDLPALPLIVLDMAPFTDGRSFTQARILRERLGFAGELRALGDFLRDQIFFLGRVGVNAFEFPEGTDLADRLKAFKEFSVTYQAAVDTQEPLYRRR